MIERWEISPEILAEVLVPYRHNCKYVKRMWIEYLPVGDGVTADQSEASIVGDAELTIEESCYIDSTGHFNAVEFQICANQLMYATFAECVRRRLVRSMLSLDLQGYWERRLPNVLITNVTSAYKKVLNPRKFRGRHQLERSYLIKDRVFWEGTFEYTDDEGGLADGSIVNTLFLGPPLAPKG